MSDLDSNESEQKHPEPSSHVNNEEKENEPVAPLRSSIMVPQPMDRRKNRPALISDAGKGAHLWSSKSIAFEHEQMIQAFQHQLQEHEIAGHDSSDIDFLTDSDAPTTVFNRPQMTNLKYITSISADDSLRFNETKTLKNKLDDLHDKISRFHKRLFQQMSATKNDKLRKSYSKAADFLDELQEEIDQIDDNIAQNDNKFHEMEVKLQSTEQRYRALLTKLQNSKFNEKQLTQQVDELKTKVDRLEKLELISNMILPENILDHSDDKIYGDEDEDEDEQDEDEKDDDDETKPSYDDPEATKRRNSQMKKLKSEHKKKSNQQKRQMKLFIDLHKTEMDSLAEEKNRINEEKMRLDREHNALKKRYKKQSEWVKRERARRRARAAKPCPEPKWKTKPNIDIEKHPYLYSDFDEDENPSVKSVFRKLWIHEIGFTMFNAHG